MSTQSHAQVAVAIRLPTGLVETFWIDPFEVMENFPHSISEVRKKYGKPFRTPKKPPPPIEGGGAERSALPPSLTREGASPPPSAGGGGLGRRSAVWTRSTTEEMVAELSAERSALAELAADMARLDGELVPVRDRVKFIHEKILDTHSNDHGESVLRLDRRNERVGLWSQLMDVSIHWGPLRGVRARLAGQVREAERKIVSLEKRLASARAKGKRHAEREARA